MQLNRATLASSKRFLGPLQLSKELGPGGGGAAQDRDQSALFELRVGGGQESALSGPKVESAAQVFLAFTRSPLIACITRLRVQIPFQLAYK